jgi:aspartyl-tRNA(Asn)/glutamyl-tRNA(Gln) amidotransferase subunit C
MDRQTVDKIAMLARLDLSEAERERMAAQLGDIIAYADMVSEIDTREVEPFLHAAAESNVFRKDVPAPSLSPAEALAAAPQRKGDFFRVPRVVDGTGKEA